MKRISIVVVVLLFVFLSRDKMQKQEELESSIPSRKEYEDELYIRVLLKDTNFEQITHSEILVSCEQGMVVGYGENEQSVERNEMVRIDSIDERFTDGTIHIVPKNGAKLTLHHMKRSYGMPSYHGNIELFKVEDRIAIVNELPLEIYLKYVVPSEMPSSYEMEALKAQAICARSYAYGKLEAFAYPEYQAHVDDSTSFQVYGNIESYPRTDEAVKTTAGMLLMEGEEIADAFFFSTSCGKTTSVAVVNEIGEAYEKELPWYRWNISVSKTELERIIETNEKKDIGQLQKIEVTERGEGGIVLRVKATGTNGTIDVATENKIRRVLADSSLIVHRQDGSEMACSSLLPSAFFTIEEKDNIYLIEGGGYGHGTGMSQNGANEMAKEGKKYIEILEFFYPGTSVGSIQNTLRD